MEANGFQTYDSLPTFILFAWLGAVDNTNNHMDNCGTHDWFGPNFTVDHTIYTEHWQNKLIENEAWT